MFFKTKTWNLRWNTKEETEVTYCTVTGKNQRNVIVSSSLSILKYLLFVHKLNFVSHCGSKTRLVSESRDIWEYFDCLLMWKLIALLL